MNPVHDWFQNNLDLTQLVYGLSITAIGCAIIFQPKRHTRFKLGGILWLFAGYALLHAPADFIHMRQAARGEPHLHQHVAQVLTLSSYVFLFEFGRRLVGLSRRTLPWWVLPMTLAVILPVGLMSADPWKTESVLFGYFVRFPAGMMSGLGFYWFFKSNADTLAPLRVKKYFLGAAGALFLWAFFCGVVRTESDILIASWLNKRTFFETLSVPVYLFRAACAVVVVWGISGILSIFNWESLQDLETAKTGLEDELAERLKAQDALKRQEEHLATTVKERTSKLQHNYDNQRVLKGLLQLSMGSMSLDTFLEKALESITAIPWLGPESKAAFFLVSDEGDRLQMRASSGYQQTEKNYCETVRFGQCLCGRAVASGEIVHPSDIDGRHEIRFDGIESHGQYCVPLTFADKPLGVVSLHLPSGHIRDKDEEQFLQTAANALSGIIARRRAEETLEETQLAYQGQLRSLASTLALVEEKERRRIATELHDRIGQNLAMARMKLSSVCAEMPDLGTSGPLATVQELLEQTVADTRSLTFEISPPVLYELGLEAALEWLIERTQNQHGLRGEFVDDGRAKPLKEDIRVLLFQAARELLFNVAKYAKATNFVVSIETRDHTVRVRVEDDGVGFDLDKLISTSATDRTGFGLFSIRERMALVGGEFRMESQPGHGTAATLIAPLEEAAPEVLAAKAS